MKNNKLTAKYVKDVFRFMEIYHLTRTAIRNINFEIKNNKYHILEFSLENFKHYHGNTVQELLESFKQSTIYMKEVV